MTDQPPTPPADDQAAAARLLRLVEGLELDSAVQDAKAAASPPIDKHLHDTRGTFGTRLRKKARLTAAEIADILGWDEDRAERLLAVYVDRDDIVRSIAERIRRNEAGS